MYHLQRLKRIVIAVLDDSCRRIDLLLPSGWQTCVYVDLRVPYSYVLRWCNEFAIAIAFWRYCFIGFPYWPELLNHHCNCMTRVTHNSDLRDWHLTKSPNDYHIILWNTLFFSVFVAPYEHDSTMFRVASSRNGHPRVDLAARACFR